MTPDARPLTAVLVDAMMAHGVWQRYMRGGHVIDARKNAEALAEILAAALTPSEARALPSTPPPTLVTDSVKDVADTLCFIRRHDHIEDASCSASWDEAERIIGALVARYSHRVEAD